ncbi:hypothetical protein UCRNP2_5306 [Neofusicoccum parvum UCRNP2]|uniref:Uncharacterized protein n=1 Tax=Botryosphaeria parva (strain UCR-NP2) TaxID=1287680 RepID=R1EJJ7_BOTPV|nr:hypothetical protein UCRNP2_5306 [Neofusicoccum parvum UCRNP2]
MDGLADSALRLLFEDALASASPAIVSSRVQSHDQSPNTANATINGLCCELMCLVADHLTAREVRQLRLTNRQICGQVYEHFISGCMEVVRRVHTTKQAPYDDMVHFTKNTIELSITHSSLKRLEAISLTKPVAHAIHGLIIDVSQLDKLAVEVVKKTLLPPMSKEDRTILQGQLYSYRQRLEEQKEMIQSGADLSMLCTALSRMPHILDIRVQGWECKAPGLQQEDGTMWAVVGRHLPGPLTERTHERLIKVQKKTTYRIASLVIAALSKVMLPLDIFRVWHRHHWCRNGAPNATFLLPNWELTLGLRVSLFSLRYLSLALSPSDDDRVLPGRTNTLCAEMLIEFLKACRHLEGLRLYAPGWNPLSLQDPPFHENATAAILEALQPNKMKKLRLQNFKCSERDILMFLQTHESSLEVISLNVRLSNRSIMHALLRLHFMQAFHHVPLRRFCIKITRLPPPGVQHLGPNGKPAPEFGSVSVGY